MDKVRFIFSETLATLCLVLLGLVAAKAVSSLRSLSPPRSAGRGLAVLRVFLYAVILGLVIMGARGLGTDVSAGLRAMASLDDAAHARGDGAYSNALRAVKLRPGTLVYWNILENSKFLLGQFDSMLNDEPALRGLSGGKLDEETNLRLASCHYFLGQYDQVFPITEQIIKNNRMLASPYVLEGMAYMAQTRFARARQRFLDVLQIFPTQESAVDGLAHANYLMGNSAGALEVLSETDKFSFSPEARKRFNALKAFYAQ